MYSGTGIGFQTIHFTQMNIHTCSSPLVTNLDKLLIVADDEVGNAVIMHGRKVMQQHNRQIFSLYILLQMYEHQYQLKI
jgi:hypothetical protein